MPNDLDYVDPANKTTQQPAFNADTLAQGVFQGDVIIRTALVEGLAELRRRPYLLDYVFNSLRNDPVTQRVYGAKIADAGRNWFLATDVPVVLDFAAQQPPEATMVSIALVDSTEAEKTLAQLHHDTTEAVAPAWPVLAGPFAAASYDQATGVLVLPQDVGDAVFVVAGMTVLDDAGRVAAVTEVVDRYTLVLEPGLGLELSKTFLRGAAPVLLQGLESLSFRETYRVGVHCHGDPLTLVWLHSIVLWSLLRGTQSLLEARGFERSEVSSSPFARDDRFGVERMWTRFINLTGYVRHSWPKGLVERPTHLGVVSPGGILVAAAGNTSEAFEALPGQDDPEWLAQQGVVVLGDDE